MSSEDQVSRIIQTQHPTLGFELQNAINSLRKLQKIAGGGDTPIGVRPLSEETFVSTQHSTDDFNVEASDATQVSDADNPEAVRIEDSVLFAAGDCFGRYQITRQLGKGAMGAVFLAYDGQLERYVALKIPILTNVDTIERFYREARAAAKLRSDSICAVYDVNQIDGIHFISMEFIDGEPLSKFYASGQLTTIEEILNIVIKVALALQHAHDQKIIHRDIKLDNIMIAPDRRPVIMDFGLARSVEQSDISLTKLGSLLGTPAYMSPEQTEGDQSKLTAATDIYSLGVVLYHLIAGKLPFTGSVSSVIAKIARDEPARPSTVNPTIQRGSRIEETCLKMMAKAPVDRFASMNEVAETLRGCLRSGANLSESPAGFGRFFRKLLARG